MLCEFRRTASRTCLAIVALLVFLSACSKTEKPSIKVFASPDEAGDAVLQAAKSGDQAAVLAIFGPESKDIIYSGDAVQDKSAVERFINAYQVMHRWRMMRDGSQDLLVGADNYPFPIPLKKNASGQWYFDIAAGKDEILARRIGRNELAVIDVCAALADAQHDYFSQPRNGEKTKQYALKFISDPGTQDGLYWDSPPDQPRSPLGPLAAFASNEGYSVKPEAHQPFHGYYFRMLTKQGSKAPGGAKDYVVNGKLTGGFAFLAYPAEYRNSGVMTFTVGPDGVVYQKDLGVKTSDIAAAMTEYDPGDGWANVAAGE